MSDELPKIELVESDAGEIVFVAENLTISIEAQNDNIKLEVTNEDGSTYADVCSRDMFESSQKRSRVANSISDDIHVDASHVKSVFREIGVAMDEMEDDLMTDDGRSLLERTEDVMGFQTPDESKIEVILEADSASKFDGSRTIVLDSDDLMSDDPSVVESKHFAAFFSKIDLSEDDWEKISERWIESMTVEQAETITEDERIARRIVDAVGKAVSHKVFFEADAMSESEKAAVWDDGDVMVRSSLVQEIVSDHTDKSGAGYAGTLSATLQKMGIMPDSASSIRVDGSRIRVWKFDAESLGVDESDVRMVETGEADYLSSVAGDAE